ncbi:MAG TPA: hypothetical protein VNO34_03615 [Actinomycetota bacterium]|nr:hypothetical protein [Actinomycetota bacterium]
MGLGFLGWEEGLHLHCHMLAVRPEWQGGEWGSPSSWPSGRPAWNGEWRRSAGRSTPWAQERAPGPGPGAGPGLAGGLGACFEAGLVATWVELEAATARYVFEAEA